MKLQSKSLITNLILPLILFIVIILITFQEMSKSKISDLTDTQVAVLHFVSSDISGSILEFRDILRIGSRLPAIQKLIPLVPQDHIEGELNLIPEYKSAVANLEGIAINFSNIDLLYYSVMNSPILISNRWAATLPGFDARERGWFKSAVEKKDTYITPPYLTADQNENSKLTMSMSHPINQKNKILGVIGMDFSIESIVQDIKKTQEKHPEILLTLFNTSNQQILYNKTTTFEDEVYLKDLFEPLGYNEKQSKDFLNTFTRVATQGGGDIYDSHRVVAIQKINGAPWVVTASFSKEKLLRDNISELLFTYIIASVGFGDILLIGFFITKRFISHSR